MPALELSLNSRHALAQLVAEQPPSQDSGAECTDRAALIAKTITGKLNPGVRCGQWVVVLVPAAPPPPTITFYTLGLLC